MLRDGMPVDVSGWNGLTALQQATATTDVIKHLVHKGADVNRQTQLNKNTPLHYAARQQHCSHPTVIKIWSGHELKKYQQ